MYCPRCQTDNRKKPAIASIVGWPWNEVYEIANRASTW